ncbi:tyrosine-type recombinase/integrase [Adlercreutzia sp. ZJ242]|uniref:tyrosine-type recombinase/integrase n=1 Tax=Adlercreutzia sp. ZJ242 TaxID=2709409 RepID=UPI0013EC4ED7|nr:tyrosine-type recombinase/integrase [Adlercreutzia sp. ZJ242]
MGRKLLDVIDDADRYMVDELFSNATIEGHRQGWRWLASYAEEADAEELTDDFIKQALRDSPTSHILPISRLLEFDRHGVYLVRSDIQYECPERFRPIVDGYREHLARKGLARKTIRCRLNAARRFFSVMDAKVTEIEELTAEQVTEYLLSLRAEMAPKSVSVMVTRLRCLLGFLAETREMQGDPGRALRGKCSRAAPSLPTGFTTEEVAALLDAAAESDSRPKMKVAIILLLATYGLRIGEIRSLTFDDVDWATGEIFVGHRKNAQSLTLDLVASVKLAIIDYVKHERPESELRTIFLTEDKPHRPYAEGSTMYYLVTHLCAKAGIDVSGRSHGPHAIRHSVATSMLDSGEAYETIGSVLGQLDSNSPRLYLEIDVERLRKAALEVPTCLAS